MSHADDGLGHRRHLRGFKRGQPDYRDMLAPLHAHAPLPPAAGPKQFRPASRDQGDEGACTAYAAVCALRTLRASMTMTDVDGSEQFLYYVERALIEGNDPAEDSGAYIRDTFKSLAKYGLATNATHPRSRPMAEKPSDAAFAEAEGHKLLRYNYCPDYDAIRNALALGYPVEFGFEVPESMMTAETAATGELRYPDVGEKMVGGHAVCAVWYDDARAMPGEPEPGALFCANSWGEAWGLDGCFWLPKRYWTAPLPLASDAWCPRLEA